MDKSFRRFGVFTIILLSIGIEVQSAERYEFYNGIRGLGMGGAQIATVNDETALIINPAATGKLRNMFLTVVDPEVSINSQTNDSLSLNLMKGVDPQDILNALRVSPDKHFHQNIQAFPSFVMRNFGFGVLGKYQTNARIDSITSMYNLDYRNDYAGVIGANFRFFEGRVKIGASARVVNRSEIKNSFATNSTNITVGGSSAEGLGVAGDLGLILTSATNALPTLSFVLRDIGNTKYNVSDGIFNDTANDPLTTDQTLDAAFAFFPITGKRKRLTFTMEYRDILDVAKEEDEMKKAHVGIEVNYSDSFFIRAGMNQRYWTAGLEFAFSKFQFQLASYGEEMGTDDDNEEDRRFAAKFAFRF